MNALTDSNKITQADRTDRVRIEVTGPDRAKTLHNLTTQEIKRLAGGTGCEAFVTTHQGKTLGLVTIHNLDDRLFLRADAASAEPILAHFRKQAVFDDVEFADVSDRTSETHIFGPGAEVKLAALGLKLPTGDLGIVSSEAGKSVVRVIRETPTTEPGFTLIYDRNEAADLSDIPTLDSSSFDALRIEAGTPKGGQEVTPDRLPQELNRDARAISVVKGCYLGQETVARLDALGHVNKIVMAGVVETAEVPAPGTKLLNGDAEVGVVTSSAYSSSLERGILLGIVKVAFAKAGTKLGFAGANGPVGVTVQTPPLRTIAND